MHPSVHNQPPLVERLMCQCAAMTDVRCERPRAVNGGSHSASAQCASVTEGPLLCGGPVHDCSYSIVSPRLALLCPDRHKSQRVDSGFSHDEHGEPLRPAESHREFMWGIHGPAHGAHHGAHSIHSKAIGGPFCHSEHDAAARVRGQWVVGVLDANHDAGGVILWYLIPRAAVRVALCQG